MNKIFETILKYENQIVRKNLYEITKNLEMERDSIDKICNFVNLDLEINSECAYETKIINVRNDLKTLNNIIKYPITSKVILKNTTLTNKLFKLYEADSKDLETNLALTNIIKKLTENTNNNDQIILLNPELISHLLASLKNRHIQESEIEKEILDNELSAFSNLLGNNFKDLMEKEVLTENDLKFVCELHSENQNSGSILRAIIDSINYSINQEQAAYDRFLKEVFILFKNREK